MNQEHPRQTPVTADSVVKGFGVTASPLNSVKFELGVVLCVAVVLWFAVDSITAGVVGQMLILAIYGIVGMFWIVYRTKRVLRHQSSTTDRRVAEQ